MSDKKRRGLFFNAFTGRGGDVTGEGTGNIREKLQAAFGTNRRGGVDTKTAAQKLGVSQRTVQRWITTSGKETNRPSSKHLKTINQRSRQAATTKRCRRAIVKGLKSGVKRGKYVSIGAMQGPRKAGTEYFRDRDVTLPGPLSPDDTNMLLDAWAEGGDDAAMEQLRDLYGDRYLEDWDFGEIYDINLSDRP